jgi:16S rRNA (cytidine1402-2'-O)-methyltransferase
VLGQVLYIVATPIGNLKDITLRALEVLKECDYILAEDTRHSLKLLSHYSIQKKIISFHEFNENQREDDVIADLKEGKNIALISDAGTPLISDPGFKLVHRCRADSVPITSIPGPCALIAALTLSGLDTLPFQFAGFLPKEKGKLTTCLKELLDYKGTSICYESPNRIAKVVELLAELEPERTIVIARELTKTFETVLKGSAKELVKLLETQVLKGEIVLLIGKSESQKRCFSDQELQEIVRERAEEQNISIKDAIKIVAKELALSKRALYQLMLST